MSRLDEQWTNRDLPVLREVVRRKDEDPTHPIRANEVAQALDMSEDDIQRAAANLERGGYVEIQGAAGLVVHNFKDVSERALRATGVWPDDEAIADHLLWTLEQKIADATTPDERTKWQKIRDSITGAGRDFAVELAAAMAARSMGA